MDGADDFAAVDALQLDAGDAEVGAPELALDHDERNALVGHLDRVCVPLLMRRETTPHTSLSLNKSRSARAAESGPKGGKPHFG